LFLSCLFVLVVALLGALMPLPQAFAAENSTSSSPAAITSKEATTAPSAKTYTVTFMSRGVQIKVITVEEGQLVPKPADPKVYSNPYSFERFEGWFLDKSNSVFDFNTPITQNTVLFARIIVALVPPPPFQPWATERGYMVTIKFNCVGGTKIAPQKIMAGGLRINTVKKPKDPTIPGYKFIGWYTKDGEEYNFDEIVRDNMTLYAHWEKLPAGGALPPTSDSGVLFAPLGFLGMGAAGVFAFWWQYLMRRRLRA
ncbi:MAG: InlB B-repeat-containing protein, partial [Coriobacteriia bacterium]|nr:InlB B-repeat-containing protein [Coriobacteriia bacterium]